MSPKIPRLTRLLALMTPERVSDGCGGFVETWVQLGRLWAEVTPGGGGARGEDTAPLGRTDLKIVVRAAPVGSPRRPAAGQKFVEGDRSFEIQSVAERDADGRFLLIRAREDRVAT